jgi:hypothetical protein
MIHRCHVPGDDSYRYYGARGIQVCIEWRLSFETFLAWAEASNWHPDLWLERKNNNGNYEPDNCTWLSPKEQRKNRRENVFS